MALGVLLGKGHPLLHAGRTNRWAAAVCGTRA